MSRSVNPFEAPLHILVDRLALINGLSWQMKTRLDRHRKDLEAKAASGDWPVERMWAGAALVVRDLLEWPLDRWARHYSVAAHVVEGQAYISVIDGLLVQQYAWSISQTYDALEAYLRECAACALNLDRHLVPMAWRSLRRMLPTSRHHPRSLAGWRRRVRSSNASAEQVLAFLVKWLPTLRDGLSKNNRQLLLDHWLTGLSRARHAIVHNAMELDIKVVRRLPDKTRRILRSAYGSRRVPGAYRLHPTHTQAHDTLVHGTEFGILVFNCTSRHFGLKWRYILEPENGDA